MPSKGRSEWNKDYYEKNADDILYRKRSLWKEAKTIKCKCGDRAQYKDTTTARNRHFKSLNHKVWVKKQEIFELMTTRMKYSQLEAEERVEERLFNKKARTPRNQLEILISYKLACIKGLDNYNKPKQPEPENVVVEKTAPINLYGSTEKPYIPPSASFDPLDLMGKSNNDIDGV